MKIKDIKKSIDDTYLYDASEIASSIFLKVNSLITDDCEVSVIAKHDEISQILLAIMKYDGISIGSININDADYDGYDKEYLLTIGTDSSIWCEPLWHEENEFITAGYKIYESDIVYIDVNSNYEVISTNMCVDSENIFFELEDDDLDKYCCCDCDECNCGLYDDDDSDYDDEDFENYINEDKDEKSLEPKTTLLLDDDDNLAGYTREYHYEKDGMSFSSTARFLSNNEDDVIDSLKSYDDIKNMLNEKNNFYF